MERMPTTTVDTPAPTVGSPPTGFPRIVPHLIYDNVAAAIDWLTDAFRFHERTARRPPPPLRVPRRAPRPPHASRRHDRSHPDGGRRQPDHDRGAIRSRRQPAP